MSESSKPASPPPLAASAGSAILPCPFCGDAPSTYDASNGWFVECANPHCLVNPSLLEPRHRLDDAIKDWNRRSPNSGICDASNGPDRPNQ